MATKIRVYELARDLNMKSKTLLDRLKAMNITVGSHVSSLDDRTVARIRADIGTATDTRQTKEKPTVIRRRKRPMNAPAPDRREKRSDNPKASPGKQKESSEKTLPADRGKRISEQGQQQVSANPAGKEGSQKESAPRGKNQENRRKPSGKTGRNRRKNEKNTGSDADSGTRYDKSGKKGDMEKEQPKRDKKKKRRKKKKKRREVPAKIISLPAEPDESTAPTRGRFRKNGKESDQDKGASEPESRNETKTAQKDLSAKSRKRKKKPEPEAAKKPVAPDKKPKDTKWAKKKISFKRKEVVEGKELYAGSQRGRKGRKIAKPKAVKAQKTLITTPKAIKRRVRIDDTIVLSDLAKRMGIKAAEMIKKLMNMGVMATVNQTIDFDTASLVASEFGYELEKAAFEEEAILNVETEDDPEKLAQRPAVVTIMGHVDHGKTSLLDIIRKTRVTETEAGGITQHIGAYSVMTEGGQTITFLDTPGHEAFTSMRARGAKVTDLVVLVVAADDGVMPQTIEAIAHSKAAEVPIIVAVNKIDKANADTDRVYRELAEHGLVSEDWGGDTIFVKVSAKQQEGIDTLLEMIVLQSEVLELKANPERLALGYVVEAKLDSGRGPVATVLIQEGVLRAGDTVVCGIHHGRIRAMLNDLGIQVESAGPSTPVEILGLSGVPSAGDELVSLADEKSAKQVSEHRIQRHRSKELAKTSRMSLEKLFEKMQQGEVKDLNLIIKADVHGSIEALGDSLRKLSNDEVEIHIIHSATGTITESDVSLAAVSDAIIIGFNVRPSPKVQAFANEEHVDMRFYNVIYNVIKDIQDAILGMMESTYEERLLGRAEIREVFHVPKIGAVAGCYVTDGKIQRGSLVRLLRDGVVTYNGKLASLRRFKDDVKEVQSSYECGMGLENYNDIKVGDILECYYMEEIKPEL